jgi:hypothetical protein
MRFYISYGTVIPRAIAKDIFEVIDIDHPNYVRHAINLDSLDDLLKFLKKTRCITLYHECMQGDLTPTIELYNG